MKKRTYTEKLLDKRWQKRRLEIFERDEWICQCCFDNDPSNNTTLHAHHRYYLRKKEPWEYDNDALMTVCDPCHKEITAYVGTFDSVVKGFIHPMDLLEVSEAFFFFKDAGLCSRATTAMLWEIALLLKMRDPSILALLRECADKKSDQNPQKAALLRFFEKDPTLDFQNKT